MDWLNALLLILTALLLAGAGLSCWQGRERRVATLHGVCRRAAPEDRQAYADGLLAECVSRALVRLRILEQLDARLQTPASWPACAPKL